MPLSNLIQFKKIDFQYKKKNWII